MDFLLNLHPYESRFRKKHLVFYHALRDAIRQGRISHGGRLPATRTLAKTYGLSRGTVTLVYDMLWADGYTTAQQGRGTFVDYRAPLELRQGPLEGSIGLSSWEQRLPAPPSDSDPIERWSFGGGAPLPHREWSSAIHAVAREAVEQSSDSMHLAGLRDLREAIAAHLNRARGLNIDEEDLIITNGSQQAIAILIQLLVNPGDSVVLENPSYEGTQSAVRVSGGKIIPARVDSCGMVVEQWKARVAVVTPGHQFPTGVVLERERRLSLLRWAQKQNAIIIEDDYGSDFRRKGRPIEPLKVLDTHNRVVYTGTFSRSFNRAIRIGYVVVPSGLKAPFLSAKQIYEPFPAGLVEQRAMALFMKQGNYHRHLRRMTRRYTRRYRVLADLIDRYLPGAFTWTESEVGTYLFGWWNHGERAYRRFLERSRKREVTWFDVCPCYIEDNRPGAIEPQTAPGNLVSPEWTKHT